MRVTVVYVSGFAKRHICIENEKIYRSVLLHIKNKEIEMEVYSSDNSGNRIPGDVHASDPVAASGITLAMTTSGEDYTQTLEEGQMYAITFVATAGKVMFASITGVTSTAANIEWIFYAGVPHIFRMPIGKTTLYFESDESAKSAYVRKLA